MRRDMDRDYKEKESGTENRPAALPITL